MKQPRPIHKEHEDLLGLTETQLWNEAIYIHNHGQKTCSWVGECLLAIGRGEKLSPPIWKIINDLHLAAARYEAICEEITFRKEQMR